MQNRRKMLQEMRGLILRLEGAGDNGEEEIRVAKDPSTHPDLLGKLVHHPDAVIRGHVAHNPNTSLSDLLTLAGRGHEIESNPVYPLHHLENPSFPGEIPTHIAHDIVTNQESNPKLAKAIYTQHPEWNIRSHYIASTRDPNVLQDALNSKDDSTFFGALVNDNLTADQIRDVWNRPRRGEAEAAKSFGEDTRGTLVSHPNIPHNIIRNMIQDPNTPSWHYSSLATNSGIKSFPSDIINHLISHPEEDVRMQLALNKETPKYILNKLSKDSDHNVRYNALEALRVK